MADLEAPLVRPKRKKVWVDYFVQFRWILVIFVVLPISFTLYFLTYLGDVRSQWKSYEQRQKEHEENVKKVQKRLNERNPSKDGLVCTARKPWIAVGMRNVDYKRARHFEVDLSAFRNILEIDQERMIAKCEPLVNMGQITRATVPLNLALAVVAELDDLTVGGLINGYGIEGSSHLYGLFSDTVVAYEIVLADGQVVRATKDNEYSDLFYAIPWSQGTLGLLMSAEIKLIPIKEYMKLTYKPVRGNVRDLAQAYIDSFAPDFDDENNEKVPDFVVFNPNLIIQPNLFSRFILISFLTVLIFITKMSESIEADNMFTYLSDDVTLNIFFKLVDDPRNWSRLACVCTKFSSLIRTICWKNKCHQTIPSVVSDLLPPNASVTSSFCPPGGWSSLHKLAVCCPGLVNSGVLLENSDFGMERDLGPDENFMEDKLFQVGKTRSNDLNGSCSSNTVDVDDKVNEVNANANASCSWSLYDDLYLDTVYNDNNINNNNNNSKFEEDDVCDEDVEVKATDGDVVTAACDFAECKKRKICRSLTSHLASEVWNFSREQGNKLLASRFRGDCLYICDWPGCVHTEEKRNYMLFRGVFKNFKKSRVWRTINDGNRSKTDLNCAFCPSNDVWDLHSAFCLRPAYGFHDDGEPVVRAFVCENGHVSGAWTDWPLYT